MRILSETEMCSVAGGSITPINRPHLPPQYQQDREETQQEKNEEIERHRNRLLRDAASAATDTCGAGQVEEVSASDTGSSFKCKTPTQSP